MIFWKKKQKKRAKTKMKTNKNVPKESNKPKIKPQVPPPIEQKEKKTAGEKIKCQKLASKSIDSEKEFLKIFDQLTAGHRAWEVWSDFIVMFACALSNPVDKSHYDTREKRYLKIIKKYKKKEQTLFPELTACTVLALEENPEQDFLGKVYMKLNLGSRDKGQFFTPYHICQLMSSVVMGDVVSQVEKDGYVSIHDPCCGGGATLIAGIHEARRQLEKVNLNFQNHVLIVAQDIDETVALMCYIQLSLLGVAAYIKVGNTFTEPINTNDSDEKYWFTPMYFSDVWTTRRLLKELGKLI